MSQDYKMDKAHRTFVLDRKEDLTGVSGPGIVAEGVQFSDGLCVLRWVVEPYQSTVVHDQGIKAVKAIHGHDGATRVVWL